MQLNTHLSKCDKHTYIGTSQKLRLHTAPTSVGHLVLIQSLASATRFCGQNWRLVPWWEKLMGRKMSMSLQEVQNS